MTFPRFGHHNMHSLGTSFISGLSHLYMSECTNMKCGVIHLFILFASSCYSDLGVKNFRCHGCRVLLFRSAPFAWVLTFGCGTLFTPAKISAPIRLVLFCRVLPLCSREEAKDEERLGALQSNTGLWFIFRRGLGAVELTLVWATRSTSRTPLLLVCQCHLCECNYLCRTSLKI